MLHRPAIPLSSESRARRLIGPPSFAERIVNHSGAIVEGLEAWLVGAINQMSVVYPDRFAFYL